MGGASEHSLYELHRFRCWVLDDEEVKVFGAGAIWWPYLSYSMTGLDARSEP